MTPSMTIRIAMAKLVGLVFGLAAFFVAPAFDPDADIYMRFGLLLWYPTMGAVIGVYGVFDHHPVLGFRLTWWMRGPLIGGWMNFVLAFFTYDLMVQFLELMFPDQPFFVSPAWFVLEGAVVGLVIGWLATRFGGEGKATVEAD